MDASIEKRRYQVGRDGGNLDRGCFYRKATLPGWQEWQINSIVDASIEKRRYQVGRDGGNSIVDASIEKRRYQVGSDGGNLDRGCFYRKATLPGWQRWMFATSDPAQATIGRAWTSKPCKRTKIPETLCACHQLVRCKRQERRCDNEVQRGVTVV